MCSPNSGSYSWQIASSQSLSTLCQLVDGHLHVMHPKLHPFTCLSVEVLHHLVYAEREQAPELWTARF